MRPGCPRCRPTWGRRLSVGSAAPAQTATAEGGDGGLSPMVKAYIAVLGALGLAVLGLTVSLDPRPWTHVLLWAGFVIVIAVDHGGFSVPLLHIRENERLGIEEAFVLTMMFLFPPSQTLIGFLLGVLGGEVLQRRPPPKVMFNLGQMSVSSGLGIAVAYSLGAPSVSRPWSILMAALGAGVFFVLNTAAVVVLFSMLEGTSFWSVIRDRSNIPRLSWLGSISLGLLTGIATESTDAGLLIGLVCAVVLETVLGQERAASRDRERMSHLLETSRSIYSSFESENVAEAVTGAVRSMLHCDRARLGPAGPSRDELGAPVLLDDGESSWLVAADPLEDDGFDKRDEQLLQTLAAICSTALTNAALFRQVEIERTKLKESQAELLESQKMEAIGRLAGGVAHDFNNMLAVILASADIIASDIGGDHSSHDDVEEIRRTVSRASELVMQLLTFARKESTHPVPIDLEHLVTGLDKMLRRVLGEDIDYEVTVDSELHMVILDPVHAEQIVMNLIVNARDAVEGGGRVHVDLANFQVLEGDSPDLSPGDYVKLTVADTGRGMDQETMRKAFEPFFTTKREGHGNGLGLSTIYGIVERSGGTVRLDSRPGQGSTITIYLPAAGPDAHEAITPSATAAGT